MVSLEDKLQMSPRILLLSPSFYCWAWCPMVWDIPLVILGHLSWLCALPVPCAPPIPLLVRQKQKSPWLCASTALQQLKHWCVVTSILIKNPRHCITQASTKIVNSVSAKTRTICDRDPCFKGSLYHTPLFFNCTKHMQLSAIYSLSIFFPQENTQAADKQNSIYDSV